ncbi:MAG: adenylyl-sulfate kinase [Candidatus Nanopelagicaceae bacterium]
MDLPIVRLLTCGSVDDGKSTLIGRLLVETESVPHDTISAARKTRRSGSTIPADEIDFSLLTDGLEAEREQGITIDVAYRSMSLLDGRRLIISDAPGHEQYTRNMAVAASRAHIAIVLVDATKGVRDQTLRHLTICSLMGVNLAIVAINKLDAVDFDQKVYDQISSDLRPVLDRLEIANVITIPMSALKGDNVIVESKNLAWYVGPSLLEAIQSWAPPEVEDQSARMRVQLISRAPDFRGLSGTVSEGNFRTGDKIRIYPSNKTAKIARIVAYSGDVSVAENSFATTMVLEPDIDAARGDIIAKSPEPLEFTDRFTANLVWLDEDPLVHSRSYFLVNGSTQTPAIITQIRSKFDIHSGAHLSARNLQMNEIGTVEVACDIPMALIPYSQSREYGNFILVDRQTSKTVGAGMFLHTLRRSSNIHTQDYEVNKAIRSSQKNQTARFIWLTGLSGSGKSTIADHLEKRLLTRGLHTYVLDGDNLRLGLNKDLGFTKEDRAENVRRVAELGKLMVDAGLVAIGALVSPFEADRNQARALFEEGEFLEIFVDTPVEICQQRDPKGLYLKASRGEIPNFTGVGQNYERPSHPELVLDGTAPIEENVNRIMAKLFEI